MLHEVRVALEQMCLTKAETVNGLFSATIGGVGPNTVDKLVTVAKGGASDTDTLDVASQFGIPADQECLNISDDVKAEVQQSAIEWSLGNLVLVVETTFEAFVDVCDSTDEGFEEILGVMRDVFGEGSAGNNASPRSSAGWPTGPTPPPPPWFGPSNAWKASFLTLNVRKASFLACVSSGPPVGRRPPPGPPS